MKQTSSCPKITVALILLHSLPYSTSLSALFYFELSALFYFELSALFYFELSSPQPTKQSCSHLFQMPPIFYSPIFKLLGLYPISNYWVCIQQIEVEMIVHKNKINQKVRLPDILYDFYKIVRD